MTTPSVTTRSGKGAPLTHAELDANFTNLRDAIAEGADLTVVTGDVTFTEADVAAIAPGVIVDADINAAAGITDTKLATIITANKVSASALDLDGASDIGAGLADVDLILVDDGGVGINRKAAVTRITDYTFGKVSGDVTIASNGTAAIGNGVIVNADINASAAIAGTKISPNFGSQAIATTSSLTTGSTITIDNATAQIVNSGNAGYTSISGSTNNVLGGNLVLYGEAHATAPNRIHLRQGSTTILLVHGASGNTTIGGNSDTGDKLYLVGDFRASGQIKGNSGDTAAAPGFTWPGNEDTGMFRAGTDAVGISAGGFEVFQVDMGSTVATGGRRALFESNAEIDTAAGNLYVYADAGLFLDSGADAAYCIPAYNAISASAANVVVGGTGRLLRSTSSIKYKHAVEAADLSLSENLIYNSEPVWYRSLCDADPEDWSYWGFIAEEVALLDPRMVHWGGENNDEPEGVQYERYVVHLVNVVQKQKQQLDAIESRLAALEAA